MFGNWSGRIRIPPIVILSACDTHAADRNHATTANGFLAMGTRAVLASVFPLDARSAALFTARLLYRIAAFIPTAVRVFDSALTWTEIISGMLRMQLLSDFREALTQRRSITDEQSLKLGVDGNMAINSRSPDPFAQITEMVAALGVDPAIIQQELQTAIAGRAPSATSIWGGLRPSWSTPKRGSRRANACIRYGARCLIRINRALSWCSHLPAVFGSWQPRRAILSAITSAPPMPSRWAGIAIEGGWRSA